MRKAKLFVVSGPSGAGKGTVLAQVLKTHPNLGLTVSATTRKPRPGEEDGVNYHFLSEEDFMSKVEADEFLEWAHVHGNCYGTLVSEVKTRLDKGQSVILEIDVQGAINVRKRFEDAVLIFIEPPSLQILEKRLTDRGTEDSQTIALRMKNATHEMELASMYDERIVNDELDRAISDLSSCIETYEMN